MFARGVVSLHIPHVPGQKNLASNSRVSITSKLIETERLQVHSFGHLRKTGGWGSDGYLTRNVHPELVEGFFSDSSTPLTKSTKLNHSHTCKARSRKPNHSRTYGIPGGGGYTGFLVR